jgi:ABC-2 type transport system permease protein
MHKLITSIRKEFTLLMRDPGALVILFIMPLVLVIIVTMVQDDTYRSMEEHELPIILVDLDKGSIAERVKNSLLESKTFALEEVNDEVQAKERVSKGEVQMAIVLPEGISSGLEARIQGNVETLMKEMGFEGDSSSSEKTILSKKQIRIYFDPVTQASFKDAVMIRIQRMISELETEYTYKAFQEAISDNPEQELFDRSSFIEFAEIAASEKTALSRPNSVQQNVPAWTLFAIFFIMVPLSINMVKEKNQGTFIRLRTLPVSYATVLGGKTVIYSIVGLIQFLIMLLIGMYLFPSLGLPMLTLGSGLFLLSIVSLFAGLAAIGIGLLLGTVASSPEQSAPFGATLVVILAALGGVWVPVFAMPSFMQKIAGFSPMNWGLNAFHDVFLRHGTLMDILPEIALLGVLFLSTTLLSIYYYNRQHAG